MRVIGPADATDIYELNQDEDVLSFIGDCPFESVKEVQTFLENYEQ